jgi:peptide-methionine (R)-S-oxide reductase
MNKIKKPETEWKKLLDEKTYNITRKSETEQPFTGKYLNEKSKGIYNCVCCDNELFSSDTKFDSKSGWPSFYDVIIEGGVAFGSDSKLGYQRDEVHCAKCGGHLGHVFDDGPRETTGKRHCINGVAMNFIPTEK